MPFSLDRYWRLCTAPVPRRLLARRNGDSAVMLADGREVGVLHPYPVGEWLQAVVEELPTILAGMEELAVQRSLYASALLVADPLVAQDLSTRLGVPLDGCSDLMFGVGDAVQLAAHTLIDNDDDPQDPPFD